MNGTLNVLDIMRGTTVDGPGFRTSVYVAGCRHRCPGCHNPSSWAFDAGEKMTLDEIMEIIGEEDFDVTFSGGDPLYHPDEIGELARRIHATGHTVWLYTGFLWENIVKSPEFSHVLPHIDVIIDGPFIESLKDTDLLFRGSANQRIIDVPRSIRSGEITEWKRV